MGTMSPHVANRRGNFCILRPCTSLSSQIWKRVVISLLLFSAPIVILVQSVFNVPPIFSTPREWKINEEQSIGSSFFTPHVIDDGPVTFSISPSGYKDGSQYFRIDANTGEVFVKKSLSGLAGQDFFFNVIAFDGEHSARFEIRVQVYKSGEHSMARPPPSPPSLIPGKSRHGPSVPVLPFHEDSVAHASRPNATWFTSLPIAPSRRPTAKLPPADPLNNPQRQINASLSDNLPKGSDSKTWQDDDKKKSTTGKREENTLLQALVTLTPYIILACLLIGSLIGWTIYKCKHNVQLKSITHKIINNNKSESEKTISSFSSDTDYNGALYRSKKSMAKELSTDKSLLKVSESEWEFPRHHLKFVHILGEGCFGQVWKCEAVNIGNTGGSQVVAVKTLKQNASQKEKDDLLEELEVMKMLEPHPNVVTLIGCCAEQDPVLLIMEFVTNGTLQNYLRESRVDLNYGNSQGNSRLKSHDLISFAYQVAKGMEYLSSKGVIHRDLAARNILVGYNKVCKIADFGFAKYDDIYERKSEGRLPIRWMAIESLTDFIFTTKSDVWSFGILMWEIVTLGWTPYPGFAAAEVIKKVCDGFRLEKPEHCKREMFNIMYYCWDRDPNKRPSFNELVTLLDNILYSENDYIELDRFPDHAYYNILKPGITGEKL